MEQQFLPIFFLLFGAGIGFYIGRWSFKKDNKKEVALERDNAELRLTVTHLNDKINDDLQRVEELKKSFGETFKNLANDILGKNTEKFKSYSEEKIKIILNPLEEKIKDFREKVETFYGEEGKQRASLKTEIDQIVTKSAELSQDAKSLTKALKGDVQAQGSWGEFKLKRILEASGLKEGLEYISQAKGLDLKDEVGSRRKPDFIINLPEDKHIIVDSKVSLVNYERIISSEDLTERGKFLKEYLKNIEEHIFELSETKYQILDKLRTPDFTMMFMPIEGAFSFAIENKKDLIEIAWKKNVLLVSPSTLMAMLRTISSIWKIEKQNKNTEEIAKLGGIIHDSIVDFVKEFKGIEISLKGAQGSYEKALHRLTSMRGNLIAKTVELKNLGVKATKNMDEDFIEMANSSELISEVIDTVKDDEKNS